MFHMATPHVTHREPIQPQARGPHPATQGRMKQLENDLARMRLLNQAMWELLRDHLGLSDRELEERVLEVDLRDGRQDRKITRTPVECPKCGRISSNHHARCLYCGVKFKKPVMA